MRLKAIRTELKRTLLKKKLNLKLLDEHNSPQWYDIV